MEPTNEHMEPASNCATDDTDIEDRREETLELMDQMRRKLDEGVFDPEEAEEVRDDLVFLEVALEYFQLISSLEEYDVALEPESFADPRKRKAAREFVDSLAYRMAKSDCEAGTCPPVRATGARMFDLLCRR